MSDKNAVDGVLAADYLAHRAFALVTDAASYIAAAGKEMLVVGRVSKAVSLLDRARVLLTVVEDLDLRASTLAALIEAYVTAGQVRVARNLNAEVDSLECTGLRPEPLAALRVQLAWADILACDPSRGLARVHDARTLLSGHGSEHFKLALTLSSARCWRKRLRTPPPVSSPQK